NSMGSVRLIRPFDCESRQAVGSFPLYSSFKSAGLLFARLRQRRVCAGSYQQASSDLFFMTSWLASFVSAVAGGAAAAGVLAFLAKEGLTRMVDRKGEEFKYRLGIDAKTREVMLRSQIEFKERQLAEFYGPIYAYLKRGRPIYDLWTDSRLDEIETD